MILTTSSIQTQNISAEDLLYRWVSRLVSTEAVNWLDEKRQFIKDGAATRVFFTAFSAVPRYTGKKDIQPTVEELESATNTCKNWFPANWTVDQAARTLLVLSLPLKDADKYLLTLDQVFAAADVGELVALYQALPLLAHPEQLCYRAAEGIRSNMTAVFNAVALQNPYPAKYLDNLAWNQMVLKALFVGSPLHLIQGLDERANPELARMLVDYAHERWAARRDVSPELWRCVGKFANDEILTDLERILAESHTQPDSNGKGQQKLLERTSAALACAECPLPQAQDILAQYPELQADIQAGKLTWKNVK
ncbi:MAG: EboA family metabolite traffic protein [Richelia sp. RM2_1_2]|nr:EboA family metabolite traffic protein [Richelia sp. SM1_7_0]NJN07987.1 EboA family metabolite traffic protein [Richelia sp. RM1_1_1]NJO28461.1 EboA family metabolite traffic protein [Richelia sp. SL_2_1]NJO58058.1 EboA family metabolite traffic protein [Richelia sp. RM2_1_2]